MTTYTVGYFVGSGKQHLRGLLATATRPMNAPEAYIQFTPGLIKADGRGDEPSTQQFLQPAINEFDAFIQRVYAVLPRNK